MIRLKRRLAAGLPLMFLLLSTYPVLADVPVRVSIKFLVDASGNHAGTGTYATNADIQDDADWSNEVLSGMDSELRFQVIEIIDLPTSLSAYFNSSTDDRDTIRTLAMADPTTWSWRSDAVNIYISGVTDTVAGEGADGRADFPPNNNIIILMQSCITGCLVHEMGHIINLYHTHATDGCADTITDSSSWTNIDQMANANYGSNYSLLNATQQAAVDRTWNNIMSYHATPPWDRITLCQKDRMSDQTYTDKSWLLASTPVYVNSAAACAGTCNGSWSRPYPNLQDALSAGSLNGKTIVMEQGNYTITQAAGVNADVDIGTRNGTSRADRSRPTPYKLPGNLEKSQNSAVSIAVKAAQREETLGRNALKDGNKRAATAKEKDRAAIWEKANKKNSEHKANSLKHFLHAEKNAHGNEKLAIQMQLAQEYRSRQNYSQCAAYYNRVAAETDQTGLRDVALWQASRCQKKIVVSSETAEEQ